MSTKEITQNSIMKCSYYDLMNIVGDHLKKIEDYEQACYDKGLTDENESFFTTDWDFLEKYYLEMVLCKRSTRDDRNKIRLVIKNSQKLAVVLGIAEKEATDAV